MKINYNEAAQTYDNTRKSSNEVIDLFSKKIDFTQNINILDFGCGTGNYINEINNKYLINIFGLEPSDGMKEQAIIKNPEIIIKSGNHENIPFEDAMFDFIYMTDVIHHVPDLKVLFHNLNLKLKKNGLICVLTESHKQIESRWYNQYFNSLEKNEKNRYPDIDFIIENATDFMVNDIQIKNNGNKNIITKEFIKMVEEKNYSMFKLLDDNEYKIGLQKMKDDLGLEIICENHGETLLWLNKK